jgi:hypothetical protein
LICLSSSACSIALPFTVTTGGAAFESAAETKLLTPVMQKNSIEKSMTIDLLVVSRLPGNNFIFVSPCLFFLVLFGTVYHP